MSGSAERTSPRLRVLFLTHYFPPEGNAPASRVHEMCRRWVASGAEVSVITCAPNVPDGVVYEGYRNRLWQRELVDGIETIRVWTYLAPNKGTGRRILNYLSYLAAAVLASLFVRRPDIVIATSPQFFCGWAGVLTSWIRRTPFVLEIRDLWPDSISAVGAMSNPKLLAFLERLERRMYGAADRIITVGEGYRDELIRKGVDPERVAVVTNGVDRERFSPRAPDLALRAELGLGDRFVCSYIGTVGMAAGLEVVLRAAEQLRARGDRGICFLIVGDGAAREDLEAETTARQLEQWVVFTGRRPKETMPAYLASSDACLIHLRRTELFRSVLPSKIFEAAAMARPIVLGVEGNAAELIEKAGAGICIEPENADQLVAALEELRADPARADALGRSGYEYVTRHYDRERLARDYLDHLLELAPTTSARDSRTELEN